MLVPRHTPIVIAAAALSLGVPSLARAATTTVDCPDGWVTEVPSSCTVVGHLGAETFRFNTITVDDEPAYTTAANPATVAITREGRHLVTATTEADEPIPTRPTAGRSASTPASDTLDVDTTPPSGTAPSGTSSSCALTFQGVADTLSGVDAQSLAGEYRRDGGQWAPLASGAFDAADGDYDATIPAGACAAGLVELRLAVSDVAGNQGVLTGSRTIPAPPVVATLAPPAAPAPPGGDAPPAATPLDELPAPQAQLACTKRRLQLVDVHGLANATQLKGVADITLAGRTVAIVSTWNGRKVARSTVSKRGEFSATAPLPPKGLRRSNRARFVAMIAGRRSLPLKFYRRMVTTRLDAHAGRVVFSGRVLGPLARSAPKRRVELRQQIDCRGATRVIASTMPDRAGRFRFDVKAPSGRSATYRAVTNVQLTGTRKAILNPTFTLPRAVDLTS